VAETAPNTSCHLKILREVYCAAITTVNSILSHLQTVGVDHVGLHEERFSAI